MRDVLQRVVVLRDVDGTSHEIMITHRDTVRIRVSAFDGESFVPPVREYVDAGERDAVGRQVFVEVADATATQG